MHWYRMMHAAVFTGHGRQPPSVADTTSVLAVSVSNICASCLAQAVHEAMDVHCLCDDAMHHNTPVA